MRFVKKICKKLECLDAKMHRGKVGYWKIDFYSSLRAIAKQSSENCHPELNSGSINANLEPSPEFLSSSQLTKKFNPLTKREGSSFNATGYSLIHNDTVFSRFTSHFSLKRSGATHVALCDNVGLYFRHWCGAFTLAEVLITLGIIGVVAAMTMPSLIQNYQEKQRVSQLKKVYSALSQAFVSALQENGTVDEWGMGHMYDENSHYILASNIKKYLRLSQDCVDMPENEAIKICQQGDIDTKNNELSDIAAFKYSRGVILSDGTQILFREYSSDCSYRNFICGKIAVDLNGNKRPNSAGYDQFGFFITKDKLIPTGTKDDAYKFERACNRTVDTPYSGYTHIAMFACTAWVLYNENQDYLHCDDLSWDGKHSCKEKSSK